MRTFLLTLLMLLSSSALAQEEARPRCEKMEDIEKSLLQTANETATFAATLGQGVLVVFTSPEQTYTLIFLRENGLGCPLAVGEAWHALPHREKRPKTEAP